jgi:hypothetical protein
MCDLKDSDLETRLIHGSTLLLKGLCGSVTSAMQFGKPEKEMKIKLDLN